MSLISRTAVPSKYWHFIGAISSYLYLAAANIFVTAKRHIRIPNLCLAVGYFDGSCQIAFLFGIQILTCVRVGLSRCSFVLELCAVQRDSVTLLFVLKNTRSYSVGGTGENRA